MASKLPPLGEPSLLKRRAIWAGTVVGIVAVVALAAFVGIRLTGGGGGDNGDKSSAQDGNATATPSETVDAEQALAAYITTQLKQEYAGDCTAALMPDV